jgi:hypothetical protein
MKSRKRFIIVPLHFTKELREAQSICERYFGNCQLDILIIMNYLQILQSQRNKNCSENNFFASII